METKNSIVLELQQLALDRNNNIADLLRKALLVASKLKLTDFKEWINSELNGYNTTEVPNYRQLNAQLKAKNPYRGLIPVMFDGSEINQKFEDVLTNIEIHDPVESLYHLLENGKEGGHFFYPITAEQQRMFNEISSATRSPQFEVVRIIHRNQVAIIIDAVRNRILEWALQLEEENILGEGIFFSDNEKEKAKMSSQINIQNFQGVLGDVDSSNVTQYMSIEVTKNDFEGLSKYLAANDVGTDDIQALKEAIESDSIPQEAGSFGTNVNSWIKKMLGKSIDGGWNISISAAGSLLASAISKYYGF